MRHHARDGGQQVGRPGSDRKGGNAGSAVASSVTSNQQYGRSLRDPPYRSAAGRRRFPAHDDAVRDWTAVVHPRARACARQGQADLPRGAARRVDRRSEGGRHLHDGLRGQRRAEPEAARQQHQGAGRRRRSRARHRVEGRQGLLPRRRQGAAAAEGRRRRRRADDEPRRDAVRAVRQALEQPALRRDDRRGPRRRPGQARRHDLGAPAGRHRRKAEPPRNRLAARTPQPHRRHPRSRSRQAPGRSPHPVSREEADGEGAEGVLPQREDEGDPEGTGPQGRQGQRSRGAEEEDRTVADAEGRRGKGRSRS